MKLYASVQSERATKGQGGNKQLNIAILIDDRINPRYRLFITKRDDDSTNIVLTDMKKPFPNQVYQATIKSQKTINGECQHKWQKQNSDCYYCQNCQATRDGDGGIID